MYLIPVLFLTQKLAFLRNLYVKQSITSLHDKSSAWLGLGQTAPIIWRYREIVSKQKAASKPSQIPAFTGVLLITTYLGASLLLGVIAPDLVMVGGSVGNTSSVQYLVPKLANIGSSPTQYVYVSLRAVARHRPLTPTKTLADYKKLSPS